MTRLTRRDFLRAAAGLAASSAFSSVRRAAAGMQASAARVSPGCATVVVARDPEAVDGWEIHERRVRDLLNRAMRAFGDVSDAREVWRVFFDPKDVVGLKVNTLAGIPGVTHPGLTFAVADSLSSIGIDEKDIIVWDRTGTDLKRGGYILNGAGGGYRCLGTDARAVGYESDHVFFGKVGSRLSRIVSELTTAQVNLPVIKDHGLAGISGALKNYYGAIHNPNKYHANNCDPWVADVNALATIRHKSRIVVCDGLYAQCHGGPGFKEKWAWNFAGLLVGTDPVAVDRVMLSIIETRRREMGLKSLAEEGRAPKWLETAANGEHRLGVSSLEEVERIDV